MATAPPLAQLCSQHLKHHNRRLAACYTKECLETFLRAHSGIAEGLQCFGANHLCTLAAFLLLSPLIQYVKFI